MQAFPSSQALWLYVCTHAPVAGAHASSVHVLPSLQLTAVPAQTPPEQTSPVVHAWPSSHGAVLLVNTHPVDGSQVSSVQTLLSVQVIGGFSQSPVVGLQILAVQGLPSSQAGGGPPTQTPPLHVSFDVQALLSLHADVLFVCVQIELTHVSSVQTLPSLQSASTLQTATTLTHQPPPIVPVSPLASSATYKLQVPLGFVPLKTEPKVAVPAEAGSWYGPTGAGEGKAVVAS